MTPHRPLLFAMFTSSLLAVAAPVAAEVYPTPGILDEDGETVPPQRWHAEMLQDHLDDQRDADSHGSVHEEATVGEWTFYTVTGWPEGVVGSEGPPSSVLTVRDGETIVDEEPEELLGQIYESLEVFDSEELPEEQLLVAARYAINDGEDTVGSPTDLPQAIREHWHERFPDEDIHAPRIERNDDTVTIRYFILSPFSTLTRYEIEVSPDYAVDIDSELTIEVTVDPGETREVLLRAGNPLRDDINSCYTDHVDDNPDAEGTVRVALTVGEQSEEATIVDTAIVEETVSDDDSVGECIAELWDDFDLPSVAAPEAGEYALLVLPPYQFRP